MVVLRVGTHIDKDEEVKKSGVLARYRLIQATQISDTPFTQECSVIVTTTIHFIILFHEIWPISEHDFQRNFKQ